MDTKAAQRQKLYKSTVDPADLRKRSQNARVSIRKQRREQNTQKRRALREDFEDENQCASPIKESAMQMVRVPRLFLARFLSLSSHLSSCDCLWRRRHF